MTRGAGARAVAGEAGIAEEIVPERNLLAAGRIGWRGGFDRARKNRAPDSRPATEAARVLSARASGGQRKETRR